MANGTIIKGNGALPEIWVLNESLEDGSDSSGHGGRDDTNNDNIIHRGRDGKGGGGKDINIGDIHIGRDGSYNSFPPSYGPGSGEAPEGNGSEYGRSSGYGRQLQPWGQEPGESSDEYAKYLQICRYANLHICRIFYKNIQNIAGEKDLLNSLDARSGYGRWGYKPYYHRSGGAPKAPKGHGEVRQGKRTGGKGKDLILVN